MRSAEHALIRFFEDVARKDRALLERLERESYFSMEPERWCFTLPGLYSYLKRHHDAFGSISYRKFRQLLFDSPINQTAKAYGAEVTVAENRAKVDQSIYALVWRTPAKQ